MFDTASAVRRCLVDLDILGIRKVWAFIAPHLPQPKSDRDTLVMLHAARTVSESVPFQARAYSHRWLTERGLPSQLPDALKPKAERAYPRVVSGVGISVNSKYVEVKNRVRGAMEYAVEDCYAMGDEDPVIVKKQMFEARKRELRGLGLTKKET